MRKTPAVLLGVAAAASIALGRHAPSRPSHPPPRLVVVIAVDGLSWERLRSWRPWFTSGLKRLLDEGAVATECRYDHLNTETAPGHASLATGTVPRIHGIPLNQWYVPSIDGTGMATIYSASQPASGEAETSSKTIPGAGRLRVATIGDRMVARDPRAKVVAISNKDRSAIFLAGRDPRHAVYWYSSKDGTYVTSAAYDARTTIGAAAAAIVARFNADEAGAQLASRFGSIWSRLPDPSPMPAGGFESGLSAYQDATIGASFPHDLTQSKRPFSSALQWTPFSDRLLSDLALTLLGDDALALGRDDVPDLLAVSFSANDYVSHFYGPESVEDLEILRALDVEVGRLLDDVTARFGKAGVVVALSADHGFLPLPEATVRREPKIRDNRILDVKILSQLNDAVNAELKRPTGSRPMVYRLEGCSLWLDRGALASKGGAGAKQVLEIVRRELATTWKDAILQTIPVDGAFRGRATDEIEMQAWNGRVPGRSGDLFVVPRDGVLVDPYGGKGTSHGTPWEYDTHVPMILWGGGIAPRVLSARSTPYDLAPTLAMLLDLRLPDATGTPLSIWN